MRKIPFAGVELTSQRVRGLRGTSELPGRICLLDFVHNKRNRAEVVLCQLIWGVGVAETPLKPTNLHKNKQHISSTTIIRHTEVKLDTLE